MLRIRRAADAGALARGLGLPALLDLHTGREGTPDVCAYASHYPYVDSVWNGEGFSFGSSQAYWLVEVSSRIHGLTGDLLGAGLDSVFKGMVFGMTTRNSAEAPALWRFWDEVGIAATAEGVTSSFDLEAPPITVVNVSAFYGDAPSNCSWTVSQKGYWGSVNEACLPPSGPTPGCWLAGTHSLDEVEAACCADVACAGFSIDPVSGAGCCKLSVSSFIDDPAYSGYKKPAAPPSTTCVLATTFSAFGSHAVVALASWCDGVASATLAVDLAELGLDANHLSITAPAIAGVQAAVGPFSSASGPFPLSGGGVLLLLKATSAH